MVITINRRREALHVDVDEISLHLKPLCEPIVHFIDNISVISKISEPMKSCMNRKSTWAIILPYIWMAARNFLPSNKQEIYSLEEKRTCKIRERPLHEPITDSVRLKLICEHLLADMSGEAGFVCKHMDIDFLAQLNCAHDTAHLYVS